MCLQCPEVQKMSLVVALCFWLPVHVGYEVCRKMICVRVCQVTSVVSNSATPWTAACQASLSMGFSRQEYYSGLPCPPPGNLPDPGIKPGPPALQADSLPLSHQGSPKDAFSPH